MSEPERAERIARLLGGLAQTAAPHVRAPGASTVVATVRRRRRIRGAVTAAAVISVLLGGPAAWYLTGRPDGPVDGPSPSPTAPAGNVASIWAEFVACARVNGQPDWPEPTVDSVGQATFPGTFDVKMAFGTVRAACGPILNRLHPSARPPGWT
jgi:disulfide bond formation protein DsbB